MSEQRHNVSGEDVLKPHEYDGIQEYDNPLPGWWKWSFYVTIVWSGVYVVAIGLGFINDYTMDLQTESVRVDTLVREWEAAHPKPTITEEELAAAVAAPGASEQGGAIFASKCASCHGDKGQGLIGPNLTDKFWIHGGSLKSIHTVIAEGAPDKGMPAWGPLMKPDEVIAAVSWIRSVQGTEPAGAKAPQGEPYEGN